MGTKLENAAKRDANVAKMGAQLQEWSTKLDDLVAGNLEAGGQSNDAYRTRIDGLRARVGAVQTKLDEFTDPAGEGGAWGTFRTSIADDWSALEAGFADLTR